MIKKYYTSFTYEDAINQDFVDSYVYVDLDNDGNNELILQYTDDTSHTAWDVYKRNEDKAQYLETWTLENQHPSIYLNNKENTIFVFDSYYNESYNIFYIYEFYLKDNKTYMNELCFDIVGSPSDWFSDKNGTMYETKKFYNEHLSGYNVDFIQK